MLKSWVDLQFALTLLTRIPPGHIPEPVPKIGQTAWAFPACGFIIGSITSLLTGLLFLIGLEGPILAGISLMIMLLLTGAMHEDGLADCADGLGGGWTRERRLEIMRDSHIGTYGVLALIINIGLRWIAMATLLTTAQHILYIIILCAFSRSPMVIMLWLMPPARFDGLGHMARHIPTFKERLGFGLSLAAFVIFSLSIMSALTFIAIISGMLAGSWLISRIARHLIGGQTGDVLGASQSISETIGWVILAALIAN